MSDPANNDAALVRKLRGNIEGRAAIAAGLTLEERQLLMGHASIRTTADIYGHLDFDAVADKLADFSLENV